MGEASKRDGYLAEDVVKKLLSRTFFVSWLTKQEPDIGTDFFLRIKYKNLIAPATIIEWRIQVKSNIIIKQYSSDRMFTVYIGGDTIKEVWDTDGRWLLFYVVFNKPYNILKVSDPCGCASVYVVDFRIAINELLGRLGGVFSTSKSYAIHVPAVNEATPGLLTFLWAAHLRKAIFGKIKKYPRMIENPRKLIDNGGIDSSAISDLVEIDRPPVRLALGTLATDIVGRYIAKKYINKSIESIVNTADCDSIENIVSLMFDSECISSLEAYTNASALPSRWILQIGILAEAGDLFERIIVLLYIKILLTSAQEVVITMQKHIKMLPEIISPSFGTIVAGLYELGHELEIKFSQDWHDVNRMNDYVDCSNVIILRSILDLQRGDLMEYLGIPNEVKIYEVIFKYPPRMLLSDDSYFIAKRVCKY